MVTECPPSWLEFQRAPGFIDFPCKHCHVGCEEVQWTSPFSTKFLNILKIGTDIQADGEKNVITDKTGIKRMWRKSVAITGFQHCSPERDSAIRWHRWTTVSLSHRTHPAILLSLLLAQGGVDKRESEAGAVTEGASTWQGNQKWESAALPTVSKAITWEQYF